jgi:hypothetical protein
MKTSSTSRLIWPTVAGLILGLFFLYLFISGYAMPALIERVLVWLVFPAFYFWFACFGHHPNPGEHETILFSFIVLQWLLLGLLIGICWRCFGRSHEKQSA